MKQIKVSIIGDGYNDPKYLNRMLTHLLNKVKDREDCHTPKVQLLLKTPTSDKSSRDYRGLTHEIQKWCNISSYSWRTQDGNFLKADYVICLYPPFFEVAKSFKKKCKYKKIPHYIGR